MVAGMGATGSLLAAVAAVFALTAGVLAFHGGIGSASRTERTLPVAPAARSAPRPPVLQTIALAPATLARASGAPITGAGGKSAALPRDPVRLRHPRHTTHPVIPVRPTAPAAPVATPLPAPAAQGPLAPVGRVITATTDSTAGAVTAAGQAVPSIAPVLAPVAGLVTGTGQAVGDVISHLGAK